MGRSSLKATREPQKSFTLTRRKISLPYFRIADLTARWEDLSSNLVQQASFAARFAVCCCREANRGQAARQDPDRMNTLRIVPLLSYKAIDIGSIFARVQLDRIRLVDQGLQRRDLLAPSSPGTFGGFVLSTDAAKHVSIYNPQLHSWRSRIIRTGTCRR